MSVEDPIPRPVGDCEISYTPGVFCQAHQLRVLLFLAAREILQVFRPVANPTSTPSSTTDPYTNNGWDNNTNGWGTDYPDNTGWGAASDTGAENGADNTWEEQNNGYIDI